MIVFDGHENAKGILADLKTRIYTEKLNLQLATALVGNDKASRIYTDLKRKAAESIGIKMHVFEFNSDASVEEIKDKILLLNNDKNISGIMIQLPLPENLKQHTKELINLIDPNKDVDGLREDSEFTPATVRAIKTILKIAGAQDKKTAVVGAKGTVGRALVNSSQFTDHSKGFDLGDDLGELKNYDVIISATGVPNLIKPEMTRDNAVLIDVGAPKPEFDSRCYKKASFYTPVPGGVGPMTIASLLQNVVDACKIA